MASLTNYKQLSVLDTSSGPVPGNGGAAINNNFIALADQFSGPWSSTTSYKQNTVVISAGVAYIALADNTNSQPPSTNWTAYVAPATDSSPGTLSASDKAKLDASTSANTASAIVQRDASGNFSAGLISGTGLAGAALVYNNPNFIQVVASDPNWAYGSFNSGSTYFMQVKYAEAGDNLRGFRVLDISSGICPFSTGMVLTTINSTTVTCNQLGIGVSSPAALLQIKAGSTSTAPLMLTSGSLLSSPAAGAIEFNGTHFYGTVGSTQYQLDQQGGGTVTSVAATVPTALLTVSGSPITSSGTLAISLASQSANQVFAGPTSGSSAAPTFRSLGAADIPSLSAIYLPLGGGTMSGTLLMNKHTIAMADSDGNGGTISGVAVISMTADGADSGVIQMNGGFITGLAEIDMDGGQIQGVSSLDISGGNIATDSTTGTQIGTDVSQKLALYGATPVAQPSGATQAALTDSTGGTAGTTLAAIVAPASNATTSLTNDMTAVKNSIASLAQLLNKLRADLVAVGIIKGSA